MAQKTAISMLQELMMKYKRPLPIYEMESVGNLIEPRFKCTVKTDKLIAEGIARTKKDAKQRAAEAALVQLGCSQFATKVQEESLSPIISEVTTPDDFIKHRNYIGDLNEFASGSSIGYPAYEDPLFPENGHFKMICKFMNLETEGFASNKKEAKQVAAFNMLKIVKNRKSLCIPSIYKTKTSNVQITEEDKLVIERFENFSIKSKDSSENVMNFEPNPNIKGDHFDIEGAKTEFHKMGIHYEMEKLQENPYIVAVQLKQNKQRNFTLIGYGDTEEEAAKKALNDMLELLREGCTSAFSDVNQSLSV